jgi:hypothetical protein
MKTLVEPFPTEDDDATIKQATLWQINDLIIVIYSLVSCRKQIKISTMMNIMRLYLVMQLVSL